MNRISLQDSMAKSLAGALAIAALLHVGACARPAGATKFTQMTADTTYTETDPTPSPDGAWLAYTTERGDGSKQVWIRPIAGGESRQLTHEPDSARATTPTWAPDGKSLLYITTRTKQYNVYRIPFDGGEAVPMSNAEGGNRFATYSPDGSKIVFSSNRLRPTELWGFNLYVMDGAGEKVGERDAKQITNHEGSPGHPVWAPDGKWVAFVAKAVDTTKTVEVGPGMTAKQNAMFSVYRLFKVPVEGGEPKQLTGVNAPAKEQSEEVWPNWSPDGKWIAVQSRTGTKTDIWVYNVKTGAFFPITSFGNCAKPTWSYDGKTIWFTRYAGLKETIWTATDLVLKPPPSAPTAKKPAARKTAAKKPGAK
jgi:TolB protein